MPTLEHATTVTLEPEECCLVFRHATNEQGQRGTMVYYVVSGEPPFVTEADPCYQLMRARVVFGPGALGEELLRMIDAEIYRTLPPSKLAPRQ